MALSRPPTGARHRHRLDPGNAPAELRDRTHERLRLLCRPVRSGLAEYHRPPVRGAPRSSWWLTVSTTTGAYRATETFVDTGFPVVGAGTNRRIAEILSICLPDVSF